MLIFLILLLIPIIIACACIPLWIQRGNTHVAIKRKQEYLALELSPLYQQKIERDRAYHLALRKMDQDAQRFAHQVRTDLTKLWIEEHYVQAERYIVDTEVSNVIALPSLKAAAHVKAADEPLALPSALPTYVRYEDVRYQVPSGHVLVGVGQAGVDTKEEGVGACVWIVGLSGTGKTSTTVIRVEERHEKGHKFLGIDPHWFKPDSLTNALLPYAQDFLLPMAQTAEEMLSTLRFFLDEFKGRKGGRIPKPWQKITLLVDEVNALMDITTEEEKEIADLLKSIARICGQEARNFEMGGILISQQATNLAWLRKVALMVIVHQMLMESEKRLACNADTQVMEEMKSWPIGRTYVYGVGFQDGPRTVQQPYFKPAVVVDSGTLYQPPAEPTDDTFSGTDNISFFPGREQKKEMSGTRSVPAQNPPPKRLEQGTEERVPGTDDKQFTIEQEAEFIRRYKACGSIKESLGQMHLGYGRYQRCASRIVQERGLKRA